MNSTLLAILVTSAFQTGGADDTGSAAATANAERAVASLYEILERGGPLMVALLVCSIVALAFTVERSVALRSGRFGTLRFARQVADAVRSGGARAGLAACERGPILARILRAGLQRDRRDYLERDHAVGDVAATELRRLGHNLRPLLIVFLIAPLLGLLGTVWGMIEAFGEIATQSGMGKPELLASGIYQALTTTAAGLAVAIPAIVAYHLFKGRIETFARRVEDAQREVESALLERQFAEGASADATAATESAPAPVGAL
ncbi:Biopolymer transport protein ExbB [Planctomycetes bacterium Pla163]|uniref:Biopolymer transport protein ExbB n=1 Tax=Rohdeia mirabilis TaxID=2528008 RepID=A0A518D3A4_9BACT|nr:Biopolymer transport protein ExbB [Planctomycetes bacterium Pla163]